MPPQESCHVWIRLVASDHPYYAEVIERVGDAKLRIHLYHIPPVAQVLLSLALIERLVKAYPKTVVGIKDSGGDWAHTRTLIDGFAGDGFQVHAGSERFLLETLRAGGAECISATASQPAAHCRTGEDLAEGRCRCPAGRAEPRSRPVRGLPDDSGDEGGIGRVYR
ncbi:dihydrodipicolinate synthase family protein [Billgrantia endophytica]|uniref:dihydrodipicolinate synthase family protein n=1 Tax=Billgrantia endophytica TaxID=2033802 RepID=UPI001F0BBAA7|nr:dihydrodipicolinate synthase family protein [Halomonas endophytica]